MTNLTSLEQQLQLAAMANASQAPTLRIDAAIKANSRYLWLIYGVIFGSLALIGYLSSLSLWQYTVLIISSIVAVLVAKLTNIPLVHVTQPKLTQPLASDWHLLMATTQGTALWRGNLLRAQDCGLAIVMTFAIQHPLKRSLYRVIFRDQISAKAWHQLKILAQLSQ